MLSQLLDGIAAVLENALIAVDKGNGASAGSSVDKTWIVRRESRLAFDRDLLEVGSADRPITDRDLVLTTRTVVANAQRILGRINRWRIGHAHNLRAACRPG